LFSEGEDEGRDISHQLDVLDLTVEVANEMYYLGQMAKELGDQQGIQEWRAKFEKTAALVNKFMWDPVDKFYYNVSMSDRTFEFEGKSLKRKELIGFLPLWAHAASTEQAAALVKQLTDEKSFWRSYGIPTLAANDPNYTPFVDGCCRWNGPVWLLWDYMVYQGLMNYGYRDLARQVGQKMLSAVTTQLEVNHHMWESYSPDYPIQESPSNYIWDSIMAKLLIDMYAK
jgi:glycogen debranching enzyme